MTKEEKAILTYFVDEMENRGLTQQAVILSFTPDVLQTINEKYFISTSEDTLNTIIKKLLASEHIKQRCLSGCQNSNIQITSKGVAVVTSIRAKEEKLKNRSLPKVISDAVEEHKGIITLIAISLALISFILRLKGII